MAITLDVSKQDLSFLYTISMKWDAEFATQSDRFESVLGHAVDFRLTNAYWLPDWTTAMIYRSYLTSINQEFQILIDNADSMDPYVVLCDLDF